jgi:hypothetical protein
MSCFKSAVKKVIHLLKLLPVNRNNYSQFLWQKYGPFVSNTTYYFRKTRLRIAKIRLDLTYLKTCKKENLLPTFVRFRPPVFHQRYNSSLIQCYRDILNVEIKLKKRELSQLYRHSNRLKTDLSTHLDQLVFTRVISIIESLILQSQTKWSLVHTNKLIKLRDQQHPPPTPTYSFDYPKNPVQNLSKRKLNDDEIYALSMGLDFVFPSSRLDDEVIAANIETFFVSLLGYTTDRRDYETKDKNERTQYKLTPDQLKFATKIRRCIDDFRHKSSISLKIKSSSNGKYLEILRNLAKDKSIIITKADKGRAVVILDREDYLNKMEVIINDPLTFKQIDKDPTIAEEDRLIRKLRQMKERGFINEAEYNHCYPTGSQPARLYGLPKVHKTGTPLRPILSASGTFNFGIAQLLVRRLSHLAKHPTIIEDTFKFVDELHSLDFDMTTHKLVSFDVVSLFTMVPLKMTINIILDELYKDKCDCFQNISDNEEDNNGKKEKSKKKKNKKKKKRITCNVCLDRADMEWLLETATSRTHFHFNNKIFAQINGVSMGSPLGPLLANIFMVHLEKNVMELLQQHGVAYWRRYVDDTIALVKGDADVDKLTAILNSFHPSIQFTKEPEINQSLPFLDILIHRRSSPNDSRLDHSWFSTSIFRKSTFTGLILKWNSFVPLYHKRGAISSLVYRAIRISSDYVLLHKELIFIRQIAVSNGYPLPFVLNIIRTTLERHFDSKSNRGTKSIKCQQPSSGPCKQVVLVDVPYVGRPSLTLGKKLINIAKQIEPTFCVQPIQRPFPKIQSFFARKDPIPSSLVSNVVYRISCTDCSATYIGKTCRQVTRRFSEHGSPLRIDLPLVLPSETSNSTSNTIPSSSTSVSPLRRSKRTKHVINYATLEKSADWILDQPNLQPKTIKSTIHDHVVETGHVIDWDNWKLLSKDRRYYQLLVRESIHISKHQPSLNKTICSVPLVIYPDISSIIRPKCKMKTDLS